MIYEVTTRDWKQLVSKANSFPSFVFRGQASYTWDLSTIIERLALQSSKNLSVLGNREFWVLTQFRRRAHNLIDKPPEYDDLIEWLTLIQHHGGPTRLLDFTRSFFVGLFFACDGANDNAALWMVDYQHLLSSHTPLKNTIYHQQAAVLSKATQLIAKERSRAGILPIEPERLSDRMSIQQGLSIMPMNISRTFMKNLSAHYGWKRVLYKQITLTEFKRVLYEEWPRVAKIRIRASWFADILHFLDDMNINTNTLFPGLDGFARSLRIHLI
jgi:hypothetical protein